MKISSLFLFASILIMGLVLTVKFIFTDRDVKEHPEVYDAFFFENKAAAYPLADVPKEAFANAYSFYTANFLHASYKQSAAWTSLGPDNVGGRTNSIAIHPTDTGTIWLGSASGGLWKSTTGGFGANAWQYVPTGFPVLGVASIAINPINKNELLIGTGETYNYDAYSGGLVVRTTRGSHGIGMLKSTDGGNTWSHVINWLANQQSTVWEIIYDTQNPINVFAATTEGVYKSTDGGTTWSKVFNTTMVMDLAVDPINAQVVYACVGNLDSPDHGIYKTTDGGTTWNKLTTGLPTSITGRICIDIYPGNSNLLVAHICDDFLSKGQYVSVNAGFSWQLEATIDIGSYQGWYSKCLKFDPADSSHVFCGGVYLHESNDMANTFLQTTYYDPTQIETLPWPDLHDLIFNPLDNNKLYLLTDAGLYRSNDGGASWAWCANGYNVSQFYSGAVSQQDSSMMLGGLQDRNTYQYTGTKNWDPKTGGDGCYTAIHPTDDNIQYASSQYLNVYQSTDRGQFFNSVFSGSSAAFVAPYVLAPSNPTQLYFGDQNFNTSYDGGFTYTTLNNVDNGNKVLAIAVSATNADKVYFTTAPTTGNPGKVFLSLNAGSSITNITGLLPDRFPRDIAINPNNDNELYIAYNGYGTGHIFKSTNSGASWMDVSTSLPNTPFHTLFINPTNSQQILAGCDLGIFYSDNGGLTWSTLNTGLHDATQIYDLQYSASNNSVVAFTHGSGVYTLPLGGLPISVDEKAINNSLTIHSVFNNQIHIVSYLSKSENVTVSVYDISGKKIVDNNMNIHAGSSKFTFNLPTINSGIYLILVEAESVSQRSMKKVFIN
ncbi:MAG: T9SS type A sorting domain-containing protein [Bacteroidetes bacterium]|nr:T9SS type A sorting domain-containing protein [Bacteroidota bacterium]